VVGTRETDGDVDRTKDGGVEGFIDGVEDGEMEGLKEAEGLMDGDDEDVGLDVMDGTADGTPRVGSHSISIFHRTKYASQRTYTLGFSSVLKLDNLQ